MFVLLVLVWIIDYLGLPDIIILILTFGWLVLLLAASLFSFCYNAVLFPEGIQIRLFGRMIRQIPISCFKTIYVAGDDFAQDLCLSTWTTEELAQKREAVLRKRFFAKQDLPFLKRKPNWEKQLAREYLWNPSEPVLKMRNAPSLLWLYFHPVTVMYLRQLYPQLSFVNLQTNASERMYPTYPDSLPGWYISDRFRLDEEGLHILKQKREVACIPANEIKTILRASRYGSHFLRDYERGHYLFVSVKTLEELAALGEMSGRGTSRNKMISQLPHSQQWYAAQYCLRKMMEWNTKSGQLCALFDIPQTETQLRRLYPHAQWVDYSKEWL